MVMAEKQWELSSNALMPGVGRAASTIPSFPFGMEDYLLALTWGAGYVTS